MVLKSYLDIRINRNLDLIMKQLNRKRTGLLKNGSQLEYDFHNELTTFLNEGEK